MLSSGASMVFEGLPLETKLAEETGARASGRAAGTGPTGSPFEGKLLEAEMGDLLDRLDTAAGRLFRFPSGSVLSEYRAVVGQILLRAGEMMEIRRDFPARSGKAGFLVQRVRKGLEELEDILGREGRRSRIMGITAEIKGCLLSMTA